MWVKYKFRYAWGDSEYEWKHFWAYKSIEECNKDKDYIKEVLEDSNYDNISVDHYRGMDFEFLEKAPKDVVENRIKTIDNGINAFQTEKEILTGQI